MGMKFQTESEWKKFQKDLQKQGVTVMVSEPKSTFVPSKPKQSNSKTTNQPTRRGVMGILDTVKQSVKKSLDPAERKRSADRKEKEKYRKEAKTINTRNRYLPQIQSIASEYGADVEALDTEAYIFKNDGKRTRGIHVKYGMRPEIIRHKLEVVFTKSATSSKVIKGITSAAHRAKEIREELGEAGAAVKGAMGDGKGGMYDDPNFGGAFAARPSSGGGGRPASSGKKRSKPARNPDQLYPDIKW